MRFKSVMLGLLCLPLLLAVVIFAPLVPATIFVAIFAVVALLKASGRFYLMTETAWAQITAVGFSLHLGGTIIGWAPEIWWTNRGLERRDLWPSCFAVKILSADYNGAARTAFGINLGSMRMSWRTSGRYPRVEATGDLGWQFWRRRIRATA